MYSCFFVSLSKKSPLDKRLLALPEIDVSGVLKSCEIARSRFARNCSFFARMAASCFSRAFFSFSKARAHSPRMDSRILFSNGSRGVSPITIPTTPYTILLLRTARYRHFALESVPVVAPARLLFFNTQPATAFSFSEIHDSKFSSVTEKICGVSNTSPSAK